jgi:hypothetical protein
MTTSPTRKLSLDDIADLRAYERDRAEVRSRILDIKRRRRVALGTLVTVMFESRDTMRYQIQEMARVEKLITDDEIQTELDAYNPLIPERGQLCVTMFIELTSEDQLREWLPKLVGVERSLVLRLTDGSEVRAVTDEGHAAQLTREEVTAAVHYVRFELTDAEVESVALGPVRLALDHPAYLEEVELASDTVGELLSDLRD